MTANILIVSVDEIPIHISHFLRQQNFSCHYSRGGLKTREILKSESIDTIIWIFIGHEKALAKDLLKIFNRHDDIPLILITQSYDELDFAEDIKGLFANLDLNDDLEDLLKSIETSINQEASEELTAQPAASEPPEIEFKNVVSQLVKESPSETEATATHEDDSLKDVTLWNAVDKQEKKALSEPYKPEKKNLISRLKNLLD